MKEITWRDRLHYKFDNIMARGTVALIGWLFLGSVIMILVVSLLVMLTGANPLEDGEPADFWEVAWLSLMRTLDPGTMGGDMGRGFRFWMLIITIGGIFLVSTLIGVLTSGIDNKLDDLRKGRSLVVEEGHTVILGWSPKIFMIVSELAAARAGRARSCIAVLAPHDKVQMEDDIRAKVGTMGRTHLVCRTGNPLDVVDLEIINPHRARSIIILPPDDAASPDSHAIKAILALTNNPNRRPTPYHIVTPVYDPNNLDAIYVAGGREVETVLVDELIAKITVQACRQTGLSQVYSDLLSFAGDEIYFQAEPALSGRTFGEAIFAYEDSALIGLRTADGRVQLKPPLETVIQDGDQAIVIAGDAQHIRLSNLPTYQTDLAAIRELARQPPQPERILILGWNQRAPTIIEELNYYLPAGSTITVVADARQDGVRPPARDGGGPDNVTFQPGDPTSRRALEALNTPGYDHVIVLSDAAGGSQEADARTLITLLHLRHIGEQSRSGFSITSEIMDGRNRDLAEVTRANDFIVSDQLISLVLAQISENKELAPLFTCLFSPEGAELYLRPASAYVQPGRPVNFYTVLEAARRRDEIAVGYRLQAHANDAGRSYGVKLNPAKSRPVTFSEQDCLIVLAEE